MEIIKGLHKKSNYQDILRLIAIIVMIIDHVGVFIFPDQVYLRAIGRVAFPLFCFFAGYNFHSKVKFYILFYGIILHLVFYFYIFAGSRPPLNILLTIFIGQVYLCLFRQSLQNFWIGYIHAVILALLFPLVNRYIEYGSIAIAIMIVGYIARHNPSTNTLMSFVAMALALADTIMTFDAVFSSADYIITLIATFITIC